MRLSDLYLFLESSIPTKMADRTITMAVKQEFGTPEYVASEILKGIGLNGGDADTKKVVALLKKGSSFIDAVREVFNYGYEEITHYFSLNWSQHVLTLRLADFTEETQSIMVQREFGNVQWRGISRDVERTGEQAERLKDMTKPGMNEPVILVKTNEGYDLLEGWHRTMAAFAMTRNPRKDTVKMRAWVGREIIGIGGFRHA